jgi:hypothetical protein
MRRSDSSAAADSPELDDMASQARAGLLEVMRCARTSVNYKSERQRLWSALLGAVDELPVEQCLS